jgi:subtilase family serine protease
MRTSKLLTAAAALAALAVAPAGAQAAIQAPDAPAGVSATATACQVKDPATGATVYASSFVHCYTPQQIAANYGVDAVHGRYKGEGQTIVLVDSYGSPTAAADLQTFYTQFYKDKGYPAPDFEQVCSGKCHDYNNTVHGANGQSGPAAAAGWAGEANLDIEWAYAMAPAAHIVLLAVPPAETEGVQGFPNLFKAMSDAIDHYPKGTIFSQSFGVTEETFGGAAQTQTAKFDAIYKKGNAKGDTFLASSGDDGSFGVSKTHRDTGSYDHPTVGWPASSPYVTAVGGTQLQSGWTWNPIDDIPFTADGAPRMAYFGWTDGGTTEAVWNESWLPAATGGGPSLIYPMPSWQQATPGVASAIGGNHRGVPDVAWNAAVNGGVLVYTSFFPDASRVGWHVYGGTSAASPQVAGVLALANQARKAAGKDPLGQVNPTLYAIGRSDPAAFRDIDKVSEGQAASGQLVDNQDWDYIADGEPVVRDAVPGWPVQQGWDMTTGFGTPRAAGLVAALTAAP